MEVENLRAYLANINMTLKDFSLIIECDYRYLCTVASGKKRIGKRLARDIRQATDGIINLPVSPKKPPKNNSCEQHQEQPQ